ncbi:hypothetical protein NIES298_15270, partial [Microcystis aeruginosa NIES-298]
NVLTIVPRMRYSIKVDQTVMQFRLESAKLDKRPLLKQG